ncbi:hypothetical protein BH11BAC5_BH11BAC5_31940 [soil metagenome]
MKTIKPTLSLALIIFLATSCMTPKPFAGQFKKEQKAGRDSSTTKVFLVKKDGEKIEGKKLISSTHFRFLKKINLQEEWVTVDGRKISFGDYDTIQTAAAFKILFEPKTADKVIKAEDEKDGNQIYVNRLRAGKINLYHYETFDTNTSLHTRKRFVHEYVFQKENGTLARVDYHAFADAIKDNSLAFEKFKQLFPEESITTNNVLSTLKNLTLIADLYNKTNSGSMQASR